MENYTSFDAESVHSYTTLNSVNLDQNGNYPPYTSDQDMEDQTIISHFPSPPSVKTIRRNYIVHELPLLQEINPNDGSDQFNPVHDPSHALSYDLIPPGTEGDNSDAPQFPLERKAEQMFSQAHMRVILTTPRFLAHFREFLLEERPRSLSQLTYYLNAMKALRALDYADALAKRLPFDGAGDNNTGDTQADASTMRIALQRRVDDAVNALTAEELPAFITSTCIKITSTIVEERVRDALPAKFQGTSDALAEVFCLTDPSRRDNPIIFASEEFHRTTQYGMDYVLGRNCRFLQGPHTNPNSVRRLREAIHEGRHHSELFLNYRRDGSPFMNLLQCAPLCDSNGQVRYFIGAQIDVSGLALEGIHMDSFRALQKELDQHDRRSDFSLNESTTDSSDSGAHNSAHHQDAPGEKQESGGKEEFHSFCELLSPHELAAVHHHGGHLFHPTASASLLRPISSSTTAALCSPGDVEDDIEGAIRAKDIRSKVSLTGAYENYLLVRPYPSLRILFTSPSLQIPGMLQSSFLSRIGASNGVRDELIQALMQGRSVTARIKWVTRYNLDGRTRWVHCTPLLASNGEVGVWMVVIVDDDEDQ